MKSLKALFAPFAIVAGLSVAVAATVTIQDVNTKVSALTAPFNTPESVMQFAFTTLNIDAERTLDFGFTGLFSKKGSQNEVKVEFKKAQYTYGDGTKPKVDLDFAIDFDLVKAVGQKSLNKLAAELDKIVIEAATEYAKDYGTAGTIDAVVEDKKFDAQGDIESIKIRVAANLDLAKLPATKPVADAEFQSLEVVAAISKTGASLVLNVVLNPEYKGFKTDGDGLKEYIEKLLADDAATYDDLRRVLATIDGFASYLVELK